MAALPSPETPPEGALDRAEVAQVLRDVAEVVDSLAPAADVLRAAQLGRDVLDAVRVRGVEELVETAGYEDEGASSVTTWARRELRIDPQETARLRRATTVASVLPRIGEAASAGLLRLEHLNAFAYGIKHIGAEKMVAAEEVLLEHATTHEPGALLRLIKRLRAHLYPDDLDEAWMAGMDREDLRLTPCGEGFHVTGFLGATTGAAFDAVLKNLSVPRSEGDDRSPSQRRMAGLSALLTGILDAGVLPGDRGVRPHVTVTIPAGVYAAAAAANDPGPHADAGFEARSADPEVRRRSRSLEGRSLTSRRGEVEVAELDGFGPIGPGLAGYLACLGDTTPVMTAGSRPGSGVLDVGRTRRVATLRQRKAVEARQGGRCATPGCENPIEEIHHIIWWAAGGRTDQHNLSGECKGCHRLVHAGKLVITVVKKPGASQPTLRFTNRHGQPVERRSGLHLLARVSRSSGSHAGRPPPYPRRE